MQATADPNLALCTRSVCKHFGATAALDGVDLEVRRGEMVALIGASGSGKSTLLRLLAGLATIDRGAGTIEINGQPLQHNGRLASGTRALRREIGVVFQQFNLVGRITVLYNVLVGLSPEVPLWRSLIGRFTHAEQKLALEALCEVGLGAQAWQRASTLSGGQQQRAALARALVQGARLLLADEPVASLDPESSRKVMDLLATLNRDHCITIVVSLHQVELARRYCPRTVALRDGRIVYDGPTGDLDASRLRELYGSQAEDLFEERTAPVPVADHSAPLRWATATP